MGLLLCLIALVFSYKAARRSVGDGLGATLTVGYLYGLLRARFADGLSHFIFDSALLGFYVAVFSLKPGPQVRRQSREVLNWVIVLVLCPIVAMGLSAFTGGQHILIQLVGLRAAVLLLPMLIVGARLRQADLVRCGQWLLILNCMAVAMAFVEYTWGVDRFFPKTDVTQIIYASTDADGENSKRLPSTFSSAHAFAGTMVLSIPVLVSLLGKETRWRVLSLAAMTAAATGVIMSSARTPVVVLALAGLVVLLISGLSIKVVTSVLLVALGALWFVGENPRFERYQTLGDTEYVEARVRTSINTGLLDVVTDYPLGKGPASAFGTGIPFFLQSYAAPQIGLESEYGHIALEQGVIGLLAWLALLFSIILKLPPRSDEFGPLVRRTMWAGVLATWFSASIGAGLLSSIPMAFLLLMQMGMLLVPVAKRRDAREYAPGLPAT